MFNLINKHNGTVFEIKQIVVVFFSLTDAKMRFMGSPPLFYVTACKK